MTWFMGIDIGSGTSKGVIMKDGKIEAYSLLASGINYRASAQNLRDGLLAKAGLAPEDIAFTVATGHSAGNVPFSNQYITDIRCCARGMRSVCPNVRTIIDIQRQSSQVLLLNSTGQVVNFVVTEKCAAGSGYFIEVIANILQIKLEDIGSLSLSSINPVIFTTGCAVFGESEAVSRVAEGAAREDIVAGVHRALAEKISGMVAMVGLEEECAISGGGGLNIGLVKSIEAKLGIRLFVPPQPQLVTAIGAAIIAQEEAIRQQSKV
ncbi:MAG: 2-hydroxyglutaryl-CoA dehydratase [Chloroflexi bacterium]|nr:2-hydroxyglutaryl-CoA dehydratase [Chloroflexota bacterium]